MGEKKKSKKQICSNLQVWTTENLLYCPSQGRLEMTSKQEGCAFLITQSLMVPHQFLAPDCLDLETCWVLTLSSSTTGFGLFINSSAVYFPPWCGRDNYWTEEPYSLIPPKSQFSACRGIQSTFPIDQNQLLFPVPLDISLLSVLFRLSGLLSRCHQSCPAPHRLGRGAEMGFRYLTAAWSEESKYPANRWQLLNSAHLGHHASLIQQKLTQSRLSVPMSFQ